MAKRTRKAKQANAQRPGLIRRLLALVLLSSALVWLAPRVSEELLMFWDRPVQQVAIEGPFNRVSRKHIANAISGYINTGFWALDIAQLQAKLEADPWVDRVSIRRAWPDKLHIEVIEQQPIALWSHQGFVNVRGELILADDASTQLHGMPILVASPEELQKMLQNYQTIAGLMYKRDLRLSMIEVDALGSWTVNLADGVTIRFGRQALQARMQRFAKVFDVKLKAQWQKVSAVDVRYSNGLAVSWRNAG